MRYGRPLRKRSGESKDSDGRPLTDYGVRVPEGSPAEVLKSPAVKGNLLTKPDGRNGAVYDGEEVRFKSKEVRPDCLMRARDFGEFRKSYEAFLYDLASPDGVGDRTAGDIAMPGERLLYVDALGLEYPCHYKGCSTRDFSLMPGSIWWRFTLTLAFTSFRVGADEYLLAAERAPFIVTEDGETFIDMGRERT